MSIWYQLNVTCIAKNRAAVSKFFGLRESHEDVRTDIFEFSFGGKNGPGLRLALIVEQNPDIIFLVEQQIECDTVQWFLTKFDVVSGVQKFIRIQDSGEYNNEVNKKIWEDFTKTNADLPTDHWFFIKNQPNDRARWKMVFNDFNKLELILNQADQYQEMTPPYVEGDLNFDNQPLDNE